jgi:hypothetical protein
MRVFAVVFAASTMIGAACSPADDEGSPGDGRVRDDGGGAADADADADADPDTVADGGADADADGEVDDYVIDSVCGAEDLPLEYAVSSDILIVLDRSGSMAMTLNPLKNAVRTIVDSLDDRI